ncbi:MAG: hypothetical protein KI790_18085 [Cyclobacteriaceae bacterium]|nr:hypothetical protein [Cyclobacteriaceae bacterium HetDA_MAG_MS6]
MYVKRNIRWKIIFRFAWKNLLLFTSWSILVTILFIYLEARSVNVGIPFLPLSTIGIAVAFYIGFKNSQSYDRFWEARKIWGDIVNTSRTIAAKMLSYVPQSEVAAAERKRIIHRQLAWINALRIQLRGTTIFDRRNISFVPNFGLKNDRECQECIAFFLEKDEYQKIIGQTNPATHLIKLQSDDFTALKRQGAIDEFEHINLMTEIEALYDQQGKCERIKNTPFPRQYAYFSSVFVWIFIWLLPFGLAEEFHELGGESTVWLTVPFSILISWIFSTMEIVGDNSEDPFENYVNDVPMSAICRNIEIDLLEMMGEPKESIPPKVQPVKDVLL